MKKRLSALTRCKRQLAETIAERDTVKRANVILFRDLAAVRSELADLRARRLDVDRTLANQDVVTHAARELVQQVTTLQRQVTDALTKLQRWL